MKEFTNIYALCFYSGIISVLVLYLESKLYSNNRHKKDYLKLFILVTTIVFIVLNINKYLNQQASDIILGEPNF